MPVFIRFVFAAGLVGALGCSPTPRDAVPAATPGVPVTGRSTSDAPAGVPVGAPASPRPSAAASPGDTVLKGTIVETMNGGGYTYVRLKRDADEVWVAAREFRAAVGDELSAAVAMTMRDFKSPSLSRSFPLLYFASDVARPGETLEPPRAAPAPPPMTPLNSHGGEAPAARPAAPPITKVSPPAGGVSVADVFARRDEFSGKPIVVRGTVVKFNAGILDRNWLHLQDGSGSAEAATHDLTITTPAAAPVVRVGDVVTAKGVLSVRKDFGAGYAYDAILENATLTQ